MSLIKLSLITITLFLMSIGVYLNENYRSSSLVSGSYYIKGLDMSHVQKINLQFEKDKKITFLRDRDFFAINSHKSYPASTSKVNDLIYQVASIQVKEKVKAKATNEDLKKYGLTTETRKYQVEIFDNNGKKTQAFLVGKKQKNKGHYLLKEGTRDVYLSDSSIWIGSSYKDFVDRVILDIDKESVSKVVVIADEKIEIEKSEKEFTLKAPQKEVKKEKVDRYIDGFKQARFDEYFLHNEEKVRDVQFSNDLEIQLANKLTYKLKLGEKSGEYFLRATALPPEVPNRLIIREDADKKELANVDAMIQAKAKADQFNLTKGTWVYKIDKDNFERFIKKSEELM